MQEVTPDIARLQTAISNVYFVGDTASNWTLVDTGIPGFAPYIRHFAEQKYGAGARPRCIVLTHGHFDHAGSALALAREWDVPIYAHPREMPYITGKSLYPPYDPTVGGFLALTLRTLPQTYRDLRPYVRDLPADGTVPNMPGWEWHFTPGHAPGHISLFRASDRTLIAGDAFVTVDVDNMVDFLTAKPELNRPPAPATCDFEAAQASVQRLADLEPLTVACGHGQAMSGPDLPAQLRAFAVQSVMPAHGRYVPTPAKTDEEGIVAVPPPAPDPLPRLLATVVVVAVIGASVTALLRKRKSS